MARGVRYPDFRLPGDLSEVFQKTLARKESCDEYQARLAAGKQCLQLAQAFGVHWTVAGHCFNEHEPIFSGEMYHHVRHLSVLCDSHTKAAEILGIEICPLLIGIANIEGFTAWRKPRTEFLPDRFPPRVCRGPLEQGGFPAPGIQVRAAWSVADSGVIEDPWHSLGCGH